MKRIDKNFLIIIALFILAGIVSWSLHFQVYQQKDTVDINQFPKTIGNWTSEEMKITDEEFAILETRNAFARKYRTPQGQEIYLFIVYSQNNRKVSHPPEICYLGGGVTILDSKHDSFVWDEKAAAIKVNRLLLEMGDAKQFSFYWFKVGDSFTSNYWKQQGLIALKTLLGKPASSALVRISATVKTTEEGTIADIKEFSKTITPLILTYLP